MSGIRGLLYVARVVVTAKRSLRLKCGMVGGKRGGVREEWREREGEDGGRREKAKVSWVEEWAGGSEKI